MQSILFSFIFKLKVPNFLKKVNLIIELNELLLINFFYKDVIVGFNFVLYSILLIELFFLTEF